MANDEVVGGRSQRTAIDAVVRACTVAAVALILIEVVAVLLGFVAPAARAEVPTMLSMAGVGLAMMARRHRRASAGADDAAIAAEALMTTRVEAALDRWFGSPRWREVYAEGPDVKAYMRRALARADTALARPGVLQLDARVEAALDGWFSNPLWREAYADGPDVWAFMERAVVAADAVVGRHVVGRR